MNPKEKLILALDLSSDREALDLVTSLKKYISCFKVGPQLFIRHPHIVRYLKEYHEVEVFLDLKLHDIPNTMKKSIESAASLNVDYLTIHVKDLSINDIRGMVFIAEDVKLLSVVNLTSNKSYMSSCSIDKFYYNSLDGGAAGTICSGLEVEALQTLKEIRPGYLTIVPGIRFPEENVHDQSRVVDPYTAIICGADKLVVGRSIYQAPNPVRATHKFLDEIERGLKSRNEG